MWLVLLIFKPLISAKINSIFLSLRESNLSLKTGLDWRYQRGKATASGKICRKKKEQFAKASCRTVPVLENDYIATSRLDHFCLIVFKDFIIVLAYCHLYCKEICFIEQLLLYIFLNFNIWLQMLQSGRNTTLKWQRSWNWLNDLLFTAYQTFVDYLKLLFCKLIFHLQCSG